MNRVLYLYEEKKKVDILQDIVSAINYTIGLPCVSLRYDSAEMLCAVFWESSYSDMLVYILCAFSVCIFLPFLLIIACSLLSAAGCGSSCNSDDEADLSAVTPLLVASYMFCYTPFAVSEVTNNTRADLSEGTQVDKPRSFPLIDCLFVSFSPLTNQLILLGRLDLSPAPDWLRTLSSVMSYLDCGLNPLIYCSHQDFREAGLALLWTSRKPQSEPVLTAIVKREL
ncbi:hypothetical protein F2P81_010840 [Scophthalmus maximus]|uniref:G-protein coupled receptors family 1 profile domain-containing protein n=1 Tax=Scophthalmus maximus TaxID=52904 RepID=A0A6A4SRZ1_SCOMX|nr:hypothetical protein F2P81_010840 [Scophthalmus maximus]